MKKFYRPHFANYHFEVSDVKTNDGTGARKKITARSTYWKKPVQAHAICHPDDNYDELKGKELAAARLDAKIAYKRWMNAKKAFHDSIRTIEAAKRTHEKAKNYMNASERELTLRNQELRRIEARMSK